MSSQTVEGFTGNSVAVSVLTSREQLRRGRWSFPRWRVLGVVAGEREARSGPKCTLIRCEDHLQEYLWRDYSLVLHRDGGESYWSNLTAARPTLFVVCRDGEDGMMSPVLVTADYDEAGAYGEGDDQVFAVPMPPEIQHWLERYVVEHYRPQEKKKRRRRS